MVNRNICIFVLAGLVMVSHCPAQRPAAQSSKAAAALVRMRLLMGRPRTTNPAEYTKKIREDRSAALKVLAEMEQKYPRAVELHEARVMGVVAASQLARIGNDPAMADRAKDLAGKVLASEAPGLLKLNADAHLLLLTIRPIGPTTAPATTPATKSAAADVAKTFHRFVQRYAGTDQAVGAIEIGMQLSRIVNEQKVFEQLAQRLAKDHSSDPRAKGILRQLGKSVDVGKPFSAALTKLDGTKLTLPGDLLGKVVVIDFWATWCRPCITTLPHMKSLYTKYRRRGVEFVGVSLDGNKITLKVFVSTNQMGWIQTYSGKGWSDPTVRKYGIGGIPSIWVVGKDGKVVSDTARSDLAGMIEKALTAATTRPAGG